MSSDQIGLSDFEIVVASVTDRAECVAEIWHHNNQVCELNREYGEIVLELYPNPSGGPWLFDLSAFVGALEQARRRLEEL